MRTECWARRISGQSLTAQFGSYMVRRWGLIAAAVVCLDTAANSRRIREAYRSMAEDAGLVCAGNSSEEAVAARVVPTESKCLPSPGIAAVACGLWVRAGPCTIGCGGAGGAMGPRRGYPRDKVRAETSLKRSIDLRYTGRNRMRPCLRPGRDPQMMRSKTSLPFLAPLRRLPDGG